MRNDEIAAYVDQAVRLALSDERAQARDAGRVAGSATREAVGNFPSPTQMAVGRAAGLAVLRELRPA